MRITRNLKFAAAIVLFMSATCLAQSPAASTEAHQQLLKRLVAAAKERTLHQVRYVPAYVRIPYPNGDVASDTGVCTDEIIRAYRAVGIDLQQEVHRDMEQHFLAYPRRWGAIHPDTNIDHRRVPNLMVFFGRKGEALPITTHAGDYTTGDLVTWDLGGGVPHIGIVIDERAASGRFMIVHNIGQGPKQEDVLFSWKITGHCRYFGDH
ncbi:MAG TPA: DUF1287 domain-containing protein [Candidatus Acidoferrum sp.]|jgi:hypothetical protein